MKKELLKYYCKKINEIEKIKRNVEKLNLNKKEDIIKQYDNLLFEKYNKLEYYIKEL